MTSRLKYITGDLLQSGEPVIAHGCNCRGKMGSGIAVAFRTLYPDMYKHYARMCEEGKLKPGDIFPWVMREEQGGTVLKNEAVINLMTQLEPGPDARLQAIQTSMTRAVNFVRGCGLTTIAIPRIGCGIGGLEWSHVEGVLECLAEQGDVEIHVYTLPTNDMTEGQLAKAWK